MGDKIRNLVGLILLIGVCYMRYSLSRGFTLNCFDLHIQLVMVIALFSQSPTIFFLKKTTFFMLIKIFPVRQLRTLPVLDSACGICQLLPSQLWPLFSLLQFPKLDKAITPVHILIHSEQICISQSLDTLLIVNQSQNLSSVGNNELFKINSLKRK